MSKPKKKIDPARAAAASVMGALGGTKGKGDAKRRSAEFYTVTLPEARRAARERKKAQKP